MEQTPQPPPYMQTCQTFLLTRQDAFLDLSWHAGKNIIAACASDVTALLLPELAQVRKHAHCNMLIIAWAPVFRSASKSSDTNTKTTMRCSIISSYTALGFPWNIGSPVPAGLQRALG